MKPFLLLSHRPERMEADREHADVARFGSLDIADLEVRKLAERPLGELDLGDYSGVFIGGGPYNVSDAEKDPRQQRVEAELFDVTARCIEDDFPYLGLCYGMGVLARTAGGHVDGQFGEPPSDPMITLTPAGREDPLLATLPDSFRAFTGHKEAVSLLPEGAALLATSDRCPTQIIRMGSNVYAAQFHPELDVESLVARLTAYRHKGYFPADEYDETIAWARGTHVGPASNEIIAAFVRRYRQSR